VKTDLAALILAGGRGSRLNLIAAKRAKPAVPFAGMYRIIDFTMSNVMASGIRHVGVLTQYRPTSLMEHLGDGESWDLAGRTASLKVLPPSLGRTDSDWYQGTADAVWQNLAWLRQIAPQDVLILSGDHVYAMDYRPMLAAHRRAGADLTIASMAVPWDQTDRFGVMVCDAEGRVTRFVEKSRERVSNVANMGVYIFRRDVLVEELAANCPAGRHDFGAHVIPGMLGRRAVIAHPFAGYWRDVGTLDSYWSANMDALQPEATGLDLFAWRVRTNMAGRGQVYHPPARLADGGQARDSLLGRGCVIAGEVRDSVLSPGVRVAAGARVVGSVVLHDCVIGPGARVARCILDKDVHVGAGASVGREDCLDGVNLAFPTHLSGGITVVGKGTSIPDGARVGANVLIGPGVRSGDFGDAGVVPDGATLP
jgi:glucose-1-phosphate adenylyltransferase